MYLVLIYFVGLVVIGLLRLALLLYRLICELVVALIVCLRLWFCCFVLSCWFIVVFGLLMVWRVAVGSSWLGYWYVMGSGFGMVGCCLKY